LGGRVLKDGLPLGEPCFIEEGRAFSLSPSVPLASFSSVGWMCLIEAGFLVSVGEGNGDANFDPLLERGSVLLVSSFREPVSTSLWTEEADMFC
jgi:hypothetical protein